MTESIRKKISSLVHDHHIVLFMKGTPDLPQCGFSQRVAAILQAHGAQFTAVNVLLDPAIREGIKAYSNWPTIPQLYINNEFVGGCDIISELHESEELHAMLQQ
ncbi:MAG: Grx4 family monothiol glutaredoxin [Mariprofundaceae bacterium]